MTTENIKNSVQLMNTIEKELAQFHVERDTEIHGLALALVANTNVLLLGEPGVGKSRLVEDWRRHISNSNYFTWLISQFTVPDEIAGSPSLKALEEDKFERRTVGMLPEAHIAFLDEFWKGNSGVINFLLPILNERVFHNEGKAIPVPLLTLVAASNELPEEGDNLDAALDRFVLKFRVEPVTERSNLVRMMDSFLAHQKGNEKGEITHISIDQIKGLQKEMVNVEVPLGVKKVLLDLIKELENSHIYVSARVLNQTLKILQAEALLAGRKVVAEDDLEVVRHTFWKEPEHEKIIHGKILTKISPDKEALQELFTQAEEIFQEYGETDKSDENAAAIVDQVKSLTKVKEKMEALKLSIKEKGKPTTVATKYIATVSGYIREALQDGISIKVE